MLPQMPRIFVSSASNLHGLHSHAGTGQDGTGRDGAGRGGAGWDGAGRGGAGQKAAPPACPTPRPEGAALGLL